MEIGPAVFPGHVLALDETHFTHSLVDRAAKQVAEVCGRREGTERADNRHRLLLRSKRACRSDRGAQQEHEFAPLHMDLPAVITFEALLSLENGQSIVHSIRLLDRLRELLDGPRLGRHIRKGRGDP